MRRHRRVRVALAATETAASTAAAMPALMWMAVPPAKSSAPRLKSQPVGTEDPVGHGRVHQQRPETEEHHPRRNFSRSAMAPVISAGVMIANIIWKATNSQRRDDEPEVALEARHAR